MPRKETKQVFLIDPTLQYERRLKFEEKHAGWRIFQTIFWGIYIFILGLILLLFYKTDTTSTVNLYAFFGWALTLFAIFVILYGFSMSLHLRLMRKYA